jgi:GWxTD domain-containing protein
MATAQPALPLQMDLDHAAFAYSEDASLLEVYLAFGAKSLDYEARAQDYAAQLPIDLSVVRSTDAALEDTPSDPIWTDSLTLTFAVPDTAGLAPGQYFVHQVRTAVAPGEYELHVRIPGDSARQALRLQRDVLVPAFDDASLVGLSDITLATSITQSDDAQGLFYKNGLDIRPNPNQLYGRALGEVYYYAEAYNTDNLAGESGQYTLLAYVAEANRPQPLPDLQKRTQREARSPDVLVGAFDISDLPSGSYFLRLALLNDDNEAEVEQARKFFVYNPAIQREAPAAMEVSFETSQYASMPEEEVEQSLKHIDLIATDRERRRANNIQDLDEQRRFLMTFWQKRDPNPSTASNEFREQFYERLQYANQRYSNSFREGWQSDRGRVYIKYGPPAQRDPHLYDTDALPHEIWQYNNIPGEGQATFVFADRDGFGDFELIHSTVAGERRSPDWRSMIRR